MKILTALAVLATMPFGAFATDYIVIANNDVNLRGDASTTASVVGKGKKGTMLEIKEKKTGWYKVAGPQTGNEPVWVAASVVKIVPEYSKDKPAYTLIALEDASIDYFKTTNTKNASETVTWAFYPDNNPNFFHEEKPGSAIRARKAHTVMRSTGSMQTVETEYKGTWQPTCLILTEEKLMGSDDFTPLETPIYVSSSSPLNGDSGIFIDGVHYEDPVSMDEDW